MGSSQQSGTPGTSNSQTSSLASSTKNQQDWQNEQNLVDSASGAYNNGGINMAMGNPNFNPGSAPLMGAVSGYQTNIAAQQEQQNAALAKLLGQNGAGVGFQPSGGF